MTFPNINQRTVKFFVSCENYNGVVLGNALYTQSVPLHSCPERSPLYRVVPEGPGKYISEI